MITDQETKTVYFSDLIRTDHRFTKQFHLIKSQLDLYDIPYKFLPNTKDIWARDYMPIQVNKDLFVEFRFDPDYLQGCGKDERDAKTYPDVVCSSIELKTKKTNIILDGGNLIKSSNCVILTDKIYTENKSYFSKQQLVRELKEILEVEKIILIPWDRLDEYGHADGILRFIDDQTVLVNGHYKSEQFLRILKKEGLDVFWLEFDVENPSKHNWAYVNFLQTKDIILVPKLNIDEDVQAMEQLKQLFTQYKRANRISQVDTSEFVQYGGALNCISWTILQ